MSILPVPGLSFIADAPEIIKQLVRSQKTVVSQKMELDSGGSQHILFSRGVAAGVIALGISRSP